MNLADWLSRSRHSTAEQVSMVAALAQAVEEGHRQGKQFSGWSPSRVQVRDGVDLSALEAGRQQEDLAYTAPEAADGGAHSPRSDVYSAGVILYEILAGSHPFGGLSVKQPRGAPRPLGDVRRDIPKDLADAVTACLERDPDWRPADLSYVLRVAQEAGGTVGKAPARTPAPAPAVARPPAGRREPMPSFGARPARSPSSRLPLIAGLIVLLLLGGGAAAYFVMGGGKLPFGGGATPAPTPVAAATPTSETPAPAPTEATPEAATPRPAATLPSTADRTPLPATATIPATATPTRAVESPTATPLRTATPAPTMVAMATAPPATAPPTAAPTAEPAATAAPAEPAVVRSIAPPKVRRGQRQLVDVRGENLRGDLQARFQHKGRPVQDLAVARQKATDPGLMQILLDVGAGAPTGSYSLSFVDPQGRVSNGVAFEVIQ